VKYFRKIAPTDALQCNVFHRKNFDYFLSPCNPFKVQFLFGNTFNRPTFFTPVLITLSQNFDCNSILNRKRHFAQSHVKEFRRSYVTVYKEYINYINAYSNHFKTVNWSTFALNFIHIDQHLSVIEWLFFSSKHVAVHRFVLFFSKAIFYKVVSRYLLGLAKV